MLCLSNSDLKGVLDLDQAIAITEDLYRQYAEGSAVRMAVHILESPERVLRVSGGAIGKSDGLGVRLNISGNRQAVAVLYNLQDAELLATMAFPFSTLRTASLVGVATRKLARPEASVMAMIGTGRNALGYCEAVCRVRPIEVIRVYSRDPQHRAEFVRQVEQTTNCAVEDTESIEKATSGADIICVATSSSVPVLEAKHLAPGSVVVSMGRSRELDASVYLAADDLVISYKPDLESSEGHLDDDSQLLELIESGSVDWTNGVHTLGGVLVGAERTQPDKNRIAVFRDFQTGFADIALALAAYRECVSRGLGTVLDL